AVGIYLWAADKKPAPDKQREAANKAAKDGNFNDAYKTIRPIAIDKKADPEKVAADLTLGLNCLERLGRVDEVDEFREAVILNHPKNWKLLKTAALSYTNERQSFGYIVAGKFHRGGRRGGTGKPVNAVQRDRVRAMQLMQQALPLMLAEKDNLAASQF